MKDLPVTFEQQVQAALIDIAPREREHNGVSASNELFVCILVPLVAAAIDKAIYSSEPHVQKGRREAALNALRGRQ